MREIVESVLLRDLQLPDTLKHAIEAKQQAQQSQERVAADYSGER